MTAPVTPKVGQIEIPFSVIVQQADPKWEIHKHRELAYDYPEPGRWFYEDPSDSGAYEAP